MQPNYLMSKLSCNVESLSILHVRHLSPIDLVNWLRLKSGILIQSREGEGCARCGGGGAEGGGPEEVAAAAGGGGRTEEATPDGRQARTARNLFQGK